MEGGGAYGAGKAGGPFDPIAFVKKPQVILRAVSWLFAVIVFGCISSQGWWENECSYNNDPNACGFGVAIGVLAFLGLIAFLVLDAMFEQISSVQHRKYAVMADMGFSGVWTFFWFVCFCYLADSWRKATKPPGGAGVSGVEAAIAFSFFSIITFAALTYLAVQRYRSGVAEAFTSTYEPEGTTQSAPSPYSTYAGGETGDPYQQPPFSGGTGGMQGGMQGGMGRGMGGGGMGGGMGAGMGGGGVGMDGTKPPVGDYSQPTY